MDLQWSDEGAEARFAAYVERLSLALRHADRVAPFRAYCTGLLLPGARKSVHVINPYFTDDKIAEALTRAAANGAEVKVVLPLRPENALNSKNSMYHAYKMHKKGVKVFLYEGPEKFGRLHGKGILVDDSFVSIGSCNMDAMALYHNFEQNIESTDAAFAAQARADVFERAVRESVPYAPKNPVGIYFNGLITEPFDFID